MKIKKKAFLFVIMLIYGVNLYSQNNNVIVSSDKFSNLIYSGIPNHITISFREYKTNCIIYSTDAKVRKLDSLGNYTITPKLYTPSPVNILILKIINKDTIVLDSLVFTCIKVAPKIKYLKDTVEINSLVYSISPLFELFFEPYVYDVKYSLKYTIFHLRSDSVIGIYNDLSTDYLTKPILNDISSNFQEKDILLFTKMSVTMWGSYEIHLPCHEIFLRRCPTPTTNK